MLFLWTDDPAFPAPGGGDEWFAGQVYDAAVKRRDAAADDTAADDGTV